MAYATDRDLLALEPNVFRDVAFDGQVLATAADGIIAGTTLSSTSTDFEAAGVGAGSVVIVNGTALEVIERLSSDLLSVSKPRASSSGAAVPPAAGTGLSLRATTFAPQIALAQRQTERDLGLDVDGLADAALRSAAMTRVVAHGALHHVFAAAATSAEKRDPMWTRALWHLEQREKRLRRLVVELDLDGDGTTDATRRIQPTRMVRE
jgi:hypothetical protein